jgi:hypothetical protein
MTKSVKFAMVACYLLVARWNANRLGWWMTHRRSSARRFTFSAVGDDTSKAFSEVRCLFTATYMDCYRGKVATTRQRTHVK